MYSLIMTIARPLAESLHSRLGRRLALGAVAGPVLFAATWLTLGFVSTGYTFFGHTFVDYSPLSQPISGLGMGSTAPYMNAAFIVTGLMLVVGLAGIYRTLPPDRPALRRWSFALLASSGIGQIGCGVFTLEAMELHSLAFMLAVGPPIIGFLVAGHYLRGIPGWRRFGTWLRLGSPLTLVLVVAFFVVFEPTADGAERGLAGLVQRLLVIQLHGWFVAMAWTCLRVASRSHPRGQR